MCTLVMSVGYVFCDCLKRLTWHVPLSVSLFYTTFLTMDQSHWTRGHSKQQPLQLHNRHCVLMSVCLSFAAAENKIHYHIQI